MPMLVCRLFSRLPRHPYVSLFIAATALAWSSSLAAQATTSEVVVGVRSSVHTAANQVKNPWIAPIDENPSPAFATLASAVVPGAGQALMRQKRALLYLALEAAGVGVYVSEMRDGARQRNRYREISRSVARAAYAPNGPRGSWDYYERMEKYVESGAFDRVPGGETDPEIDPETFNGSVWLLARQTYWRDPEIAPPSTSEEYRAALGFYESRAVTSEYRWSWAGAAAEFAKYRSAISGSNSAFRNAGQTASLVLANHFLSAVDAYTSVRLRARRGGEGSVALTVSVPAVF
jgi:hypothetical protein